MISRWRERLIRALGGTVAEPRRRVFTTEIEIRRNEELRPDRLGPSQDDLEREDPTWTPPPDEWRPKTTLGPF